LKNNIRGKRLSHTKRKKNTDNIRNTLLYFSHNAAKEDYLLWLHPKMKAKETGVLQKTVQNVEQQGVVHY